MQQKIPMSNAVTVELMLHARLQGQGLLRTAEEAPANGAQVAKMLCGIQAQEMPAASLAVRPRHRTLTAADVHHARVEERTIVRTWALRSTLHLLATEDLGWLMALLGPTMVAAGKRRRSELGLDEATYTDAVRLVKRTLAEQGPMTRAAIFEHLASCGLRLEGQARPHLLGRVAQEGIICFGPDQGTEPTYVLLHDWLGQPLPGEAMAEETAHAELTRRYLAAYGPATPQDQAAWSGLPITRTRAAWQQVTDELVEIEVEGQPAWLRKVDMARLDATPAATPVVCLLPRYDMYLLGYQDRKHTVPERYAMRVNAGGGIVHPIVLVDGRVVGTWASEQRKKQVAVNVVPFDTLNDDVRAGLEAEVADLGRFLDIQTLCHVVPRR
jgi:hypothetical protein